ncbi:MAG TPA: TlpA disulfide reductase family protein [Dehalococcoidia bacterium]|nr:TlpA disulfide reductase family protein [Dehalococcoidia bacterium]
MADSATTSRMQSRLVRYSIVALLVAVIGGLLVQRELLSDGDADSLTLSSLGLLDDQSVAIGEPAPDFVVRTVGGDLVRLSDLRGKTVVLNFWATWCPPCRAEMPDFQETFEAREAADDFAILAVDKLVEDVESAVVEFVDEFGLTFLVGFDESDEIVERYGVRGLPSTFFIDREGILRARTLGPVFGNLLPDGIAEADRAGEGGS